MKRRMRRTQFLYNVQYVIVLRSLFISDYNLAQKPSGKINSYLVFMLFSVLSAESICVLKCAFENELFLVENFTMALNYFLSVVCVNKT